MAGDPASRTGHSHNPVDRACGLGADGNGQSIANPSRGEAVLMMAGEPWKLRPSFTALVAAEEELGSLFALVERAASGGLKLTELVALFWHCCEPRSGHRPTREAIGEAITAQGLASITPALRQLLEAVLKGG